MKILVIDDERTHTDPDAIHARSTKEGWILLSEFEWDEVWLDNDMGEWDNEVSKTIVLELEKLWKNQKVKLPVKRFFIHTGNVVARQKMLQAFASMPYDYESVYLRG